MKKIIYIIALILISKSVSLAQLPQDYPFKTYMDETGNLYFTGVENGDIVTFKNFPLKKNF